MDGVNIKKTTNSNNVLIPDKKYNNIGIALIILPLMSILIFQWLPIINVFKMSFYKDNFITESTFIGLKNYGVLFSDSDFWLSLLNTLKINIFSKNIIFFTVIPMAIAFIMFKLNKIVEIVIRVMTGMLIFLGSSIVLSVIYRWIFSPGSEINLFLFEHLEKVLVFANPDFAIKGIEMVEFVYGISVFIPIGIILYFAALKGSNFNYNEKSIERNVLNNTLIVFFVILISGISFLLQSVNSVFILTGGGPLNKTSTILNEIYNNAFMMYNVGYAASEQFILLILLLLSGLAIWFILEMTGFKIWVSDRETGINSRLKSSLSLIITIISIFLVIVLLVVFILWVFMPLFKAFSHSLDGYSKVLSESTFFFSLVRSILTLIPILILQTIISLLGGFALGRYKFIGSRVIFLILCLGLFITPQIFAPQLYEVFGELNMLNNLIPVNLLWLGSPLGIILFKLYFEGFNIEMERVNNEKDNQKKFSLKIKLVVNTILMSVFVMFIFSLLSLNDLISSVTLIFEKNLLTLYQNNYMNVGMLNMDQGYVLAFAFMSLIPMILMGIIFILLQIVFFPKMKILTRK